MTGRRPLWAVLVAVLMIAAACGGPAGSPGTSSLAAGQTPEPTPYKCANANDPSGIKVLSLWGGSEADSFCKVLEGFTTKTGIKTQYEQARNFLPVLNTRITAGNPPDVAIIPRPGVVTDLANQGAIVSLDTFGIDLNQNFSKAWVDLGTAADKQYGIAVKANSKSTIWYKPASLSDLGEEIPETWDDFVALCDAYAEAGKKCLAVGAKDSWNLTDAFENIYARAAGPDKYLQLFTGELPFNDQSVKDAMKQMTDVLANEKYVAGGVDGALGTAFVDGIGRVYKAEGADAEMFMEGGFVGGIALKDVNKNLKVPADIDWFPFPEIDPANGSPLVGGGDLAVAFNDKDQSKQLMEYLATPEAAAIWATTGTISPNKNLDTSKLPDELVQKEAKQVTEAEVFVFDGSDLLPGTLGEDWGTALQNILRNPDQAATQLDQFQTKAQGEFGGG
jgi:alpha-glucoside transport system substrate-binding protein